MCGCHRPPSCCPQLPVPAVLIHAPRVDLSRQPSAPLSAPLQFWGPFNDVPTDLMPVPVLDLGGPNRSTPLFSLSGSGQVFITRLVRSRERAQRGCLQRHAALPQLRINRLACAPPESWAQILDGLAASTHPALALAGLAQHSGGGGSQSTPVQLHNVTLVVPQQDFLALLTLATDGSAADGLSVRPCVDGAVRQLAAKLNGSVSQVVLTPGQNLRGLWRAVQLSGYTGWGVNATQLVVRPQVAVAEALVAACVPVPSGSSSSSSDTGSGDGLSGGAIAGIVVGSVVGGALLLAAAAAFLMAWRRRCAQLRSAPSRTNAGGHSSL